ncbi:MAG: N-acetylglucosamine-6-phosphate deacetylase [Actinomycetota bacterium]|nr:N-acetylglucosamine-6-phosphate deacetylase [Actinomycetota bacterium]
MNELVLRGGRVLRDDAWVRGEVVCRDGHVTDDPPTGDATVVDVTGRLVAPGLVDLQCNGALGIDLAADPERLWELGTGLARWGVTSWLPTIVTTPDGVIDRALAVLAAGPPDGWLGARPLGLHLEGPFLSPTTRGAHPEALLRLPAGDLAKDWSRAAGVALVTMAPDLPGADELQRDLLARGVVVSLGHTPATAQEATAAVDAGARWVTHLFNAMAPLHHREPGLAGVALTDDRLHVGLIADGIHVHPTVVRMAQQALGARLTLVTDAVAALGAAAGESASDGVRLRDGTLAGSVLSLDQAIRNLVAYTGCSTAAAVAAATAAPARVLGADDLGHLEPGARADIVVLTEDLHVVTTYAAGQQIHQHG